MTAQLIINNIFLLVFFLAGFFIGNSEARGKVIQSIQKCKVFKTKGKVIEPYDLVKDLAAKQMEEDNLNKLPHPVE